MLQEVDFELICQQILCQNAQVVEYCQQKIILVNFLKGSQEYFSSQFVQLIKQLQIYLKSSIILKTILQKLFLSPFPFYILDLFGDLLMFHIFEQKQPYSLVLISISFLFLIGIIHQNTIYIQFQQLQMPNRCLYKKNNKSIQGSFIFFFQKKNQYLNSFFPMNKYIYVSTNIKKYVPLAKIQKEIHTQISSHFQIYL
ncbi:hypothetical protein pb186bvf_004966 [Paramecium bursaria]